MDADGTHVRKLTRAVGVDEGGTWSPDGSKIVFTSNRLGRQQVFVMRANGAHQHVITRRGADEYEPSWYRDSGAGGESPPPASNSTSARTHVLGHL